MKNKTLLAGKEFSKSDTGGNDIYEVTLKAEVPNDYAWELMNGTRLELKLTDSSDNHIPENAKILLFKDGANFESPVNIPGSEMYYNRWEGLTKQEQRSDEFKENTRIEMEPDKARFHARQELIIKVKSATAIDVSQASFHAKLNVIEYETRG